MKTTGQKILMLREKQDITQKELADLVGITEATVSRYENDQRKPRGEILIKLAKVLNISTDYLLDENITYDDITTNSNELSKKEIIDIEKAAEKMIKAIDNNQELQFCDTIADDEDKAYIKEAYQKFLSDVRVYNKLKYTPNKYKNK